MRINKSLLTGLALTMLVCGLSNAASKKDLPAKAPKGAIILFDGKDTSAWTQSGNRPFAWNLQDDGVMEVKGGKGDLFTKQKFGDFKLHLEFNLPLEADKSGEARANGGVILQDLYEIQVLDSYQKDPPKNVDCGAIYRQKSPDKYVCKAPGEWQSYDVTFSAARLDDTGKVTEPARVTLLFNGVKVHDNVAIHTGTGMRKGKAVTAEGSLVLQDHHAPIQFRNIWIVLQDKKPSAKQ